MRGVTRAVGTYLAGLARLPLSEETLRYGREVILNPDMKAAPPTPAPAPLAATAGRNIAGSKRAGSKTVKTAVSHSRLHAARPRKHTPRRGKKRT